MAVGMAGNQGDLERRGAGREAGRGVQHKLAAAPMVAAAMAAGADAAAMAVAVTVAAALERVCQ